MSQDSDFRKQLLDKISLAEIIAKRVKLKKKGSEYQGLCPFHNEKTPSFSVVENKGFYHCFGCGAGGNAITFIMETQGLAYPQALQELAKIANIKLPEYKKNINSNTNSKANSQRQNDYQILQKVTDYYRRNLFLTDGKEALAYLKNRGLTDNTIDEFQLGFAPNDGQAILKIKEFNNSQTIPALERLNVIRKSSNGNGHYAFFRNRIIFPIHDARARVIAFGGRTMDNNPQVAKYINSADSELFHKGDNLYNIHRAFATDKQQKITTILAEGYMDVIALYQYGFNASVAPLGTALTENQLKTLWKLSTTPLLAFDGDSAGQRAAYRSAQRALPSISSEKTLKILFLPQGIDPDTFLQQYGANKFKKLTQSAQNLNEFLWISEYQKTPLDTPEQLADLESRLNEQCQLINDNTIQRYYKKAFKDNIYNATHKGYKQKNKQNQDSIKPIGPSINQKIHASIILILTQFPELIEQFYDELIDSLDNGLDNLLANMLKYATENQNNSENTENTENNTTLEKYMNNSKHSKLWNTINNNEYKQFSPTANKNLTQKDAQNMIQEFINGNSLQKEQQGLSKDIREGLNNKKNDPKTQARFQALAKTKPANNFIPQE